MCEFVHTGEFVPILPDKTEIIVPYKLNAPKMQYIMLLTISSPISACISHCNFDNCVCQLCCHGTS